MARPARDTTAYGFLVIVRGIYPKGDRASRNPSPGVIVRCVPAKTSYPQDVEVFNRTVSRFSDGTRAGLRLSASAGDGVAYVRGIELGDGTIELDVKPSRPEALLAGVGATPRSFKPAAARSAVVRRSSSMRET